jgi:hypothetical protein
MYGPFAYTLENPKNTQPWELRLAGQALDDTNILLRNRLKSAGNRAIFAVDLILRLQELSS